MFTNHFQILLEERQSRSSYRFFDNLRAHYELSAITEHTKPLYSVLKALHELTHQSRMRLTAHHSTTKTDATGLAGEVPYSRDFASSRSLITQIAHSLSNQFNCSYANLRSFNPAALSPRIPSRTAPGTGTGLTDSTITTKSV